MHAMAPTKATLARVARGMFAVNAMNDGTTASGLTIVINAVNDRTATFHSGTARGLNHIDCGVILGVDVPQQPAARASGHLRDDLAVLPDLLAVARDARLARLAALVIDDCVRSVFANQPVDAPLDQRSGLVDEGDGHLAADGLRSNDSAEDVRLSDLRQPLANQLDRALARSLFDRQRCDEGRSVRCAVPSLQDAMQKDAGRAIWR